MKFLKFKNEVLASEHAAKIILEHLHKNPSLKIGLATGSTPVELYKCLVNDYKNNKTSWQKVKTFNLDEYVGLEKNDPMSYHYFMNDNLFKHLSIKPEQSYFPDAKSDFDAIIKNNGGIDFQVLGIGINGHIGFNEPGSKQDSLTRIVDLTPETIKVNGDKYFNGKLDLVPKKAYSMGLESIMRAKKIVLLAFGKSKADAISKLHKCKSFDINFPASILINHPNVTVIVDEVAGKDIK